jgi:hypothetical protein
MPPIVTQAEVAAGVAVHVPRGSAVLLLFGSAHHIKIEDLFLSLNPKSRILRLKKKEWGSFKLSLKALSKKLRKFDLYLFRPPPPPSFLAGQYL